MFEFLFNFHKWIDTIKYISLVMRRCVGVNLGRDIHILCSQMRITTPCKQVASSSIPLLKLWRFFSFFFFFLWVFWMFRSNSVRHMQRVLYDDVSRSGSCDKVKEAKIILCIHSYIGAGGNSAPIGRKKSRSCCCCPTGQSSTYTIALGARCHFLCHQNFSHAKRTFLDT